ncbi:hypothetical protein FQR65_LT14090 [Abscondita terminalis]|nr:hypothetical protein FQR65_LT14090 [Abscondita terminalis]
MFDSQEFFGSCRIRVLTRNELFGIMERSNSSTSLPLPTSFVVRPLPTRVQLYPDDLAQMPVLQQQVGNPPNIRPGGVFVSPDGTRWSNQPQVGNTGQPSRQNIVRGAQRAVGQATGQGLNEKGMFDVMMTRVEIQLIVRFTNTYATYKVARLNQTRRPPLRPFVWKPVDDVEVSSFIGILLLAGVQRHRKYPIYRFWSNNKLWQNPGFPAAMSRTRFFSIMAFMRFDDAAGRRQDRAKGVQVPKLAPFSQLFDALNTLADRGLQEDIIKVVELCLSTTYFLYDGKYYEQKIGTAIGMGSM